jgi:hypothetical protein
MFSVYKQRAREREASIEVKKRLREEHLKEKRE